MKNLGSTISVLTALVCGTFAVSLASADVFEGRWMAEKKDHGVWLQLKTPSFAAAVSREDIHAGAALIDIPLDDHIHHCISALQTIGGDLDLL